MSNRRISIYTYTIILETRRILSGEDAMSKANKSHAQLVALNAQLNKITAQKEHGPDGLKGNRGLKGSKGQRGERGLKGIQGDRGKMHLTN